MISAPAAAISRASTATSRRRMARPDPCHPPPAVGPLLGEDRLPETGTGHEHPHPRPRAVERPDQPRTLEKASPPERWLRARTGHLVDRTGYNRMAHRQLVGARGGAGEQAAGALPSGPRPPMKHAEACGERILPREHPEGDGNLSAAADTQLRAQRVRMRLRSPGRDAQPFSDLVVRAPCRDQRNDLTLPRCQARLSPVDRLSDHGTGG